MAITQEFGGQIFEFPDGTTDEEILAFLEQSAPANLPVPRMEPERAPTPGKMQEMGVDQRALMADSDTNAIMDAIMQVESSGGRDLVSKTSSARGPFQILAPTARDPGYGVPPISDRERFNPEKSRQFAINYYNAALRELGDPELALMAWNKGIGGVKQWAEAGRPDNQFGREGMAYVEKVKGFIPVAEAQAPVVTERPDTTPSEIDNQFLAGLTAGGHQIPKGYGGFLETIGIRIGNEELEEAGRELREGQDKEQKRYLPKVDSIAKVKNGEDLYNYLAYGVGQGIASTSPSILMSVAAGLLTPGDPAARTAAGLIAGTVGASYPQNVESLYSELLENGVDKERAAKLATTWGIPMAALDAPLAGNILKAVFGQPVTDIKRNIVKRVMREFGKGAVTEMPTEVTQEGIAAGVVAAETNKNFFTEETGIRLVDTALLSALTGGIVEAPVAVINKTLPPAVFKGALSASSADGLDAYFTPPGGTTMEKGKVRGQINVHGIDMYVMENGVAIPKNRVELRFSPDEDPPSQYVRPEDREPTPFEHPDAGQFLPDDTNPSTETQPGEEPRASFLLSPEQEADWYSRLHNAIKDIPQATMTAQQWLGTLSNRPGVSQLELEATGLADFLRTKDGAISRNELNQYMYEHGLGFQDVLLDRDSDISPEDRTRLVRFPEVTLPGAEPNSYKELFVTVPNAIDLEGAAAQQELNASGLGEGLDLSKWRDGHRAYDNIKNPIVRLRFNTRNDIMGNRTMFIEEIQPPNTEQFRRMPKWAQKKWGEIGARRALMWAAKNDLDRITWTSGEVQAQRYRMEDTGLKALYDVKIPNHFTNELKKWGIKAKPTAVTGQESIFKLPSEGKQLLQSDLDRTKELADTYNAIYDKDGYQAASTWRFNLPDDVGIILPIRELLLESAETGIVHPNTLPADFSEFLETRYRAVREFKNYKAWQVEIPQEFKDAVRAAGLPKLSLSPRGVERKDDIQNAVVRLLDRITPGAKPLVKPVLRAGIDTTPIKGVPTGTELGGVQWGNVIAVASNQKFWESVTFHEAVHWLERNNHFTPDEKAIIKRELPRMRDIVRANMNGNLAQLGEAMIQNPSEALAYAAEIYARDRSQGVDSPFSKVQETLLEKIYQFFRRLGNWLHGNGFQTVEDIFEAAWSGKIGNRDAATLMAEPYMASAVAEASVYTNTSKGAFTDWFKGSKVTDDLGRPLPMYHGSSVNTGVQFAPEEGYTQNAGPGFYFSSDPDVASDRIMTFEMRDDLVRDMQDHRDRLNAERQMLRDKVREGDDIRNIEGLRNLIAVREKEMADLQKQLDASDNLTPTVYPAYLSIKNPMMGERILSSKDKEQLAAIVQRMPLPPTGDSIKYETLRDIEDARTVQDLMNSSTRMAGGAVNRWARSLGHDGIGFKQDSWDGYGADTWVAFKPGQIKSLFDPSAGINASILNSMAKSIKYMRGNTPYKLQSVNDIRLIGDWLKTPRHLASTNPAFTPVYQQGESMRRYRSWLTGEASTRIAPYGRSSEYVKRKVNSAIELARIQGVKLRPNGQGRITIVNTSGDTDLTKLGDAVVLQGDEVEAYQSIQKSTEFILERLKQALIESGGEFDVSIPGSAHIIKIPSSWNSSQLLSLAQQIEQRVQAGQITNQVRAGKLTEAVDGMRRLAQRVFEMERMSQTDYVPFTRFGEWGVVIEDQHGKAKHFETFEGIDGKFGRVLNTGKVMSRIDELLARYPGTRVKTDPTTGEQVFRLTYDNIKSMAGSHLMAFDFLVGMLGSADKQSYANIRPHLEQLLATRGFPSHLVKSDNLPGYSSDFSRALANYVVGSSGFISRQQYKAPLERAISKIPENKSGLNRLLKAAIDYRDYILSPDEEFSFLRGLTFAYNLGGNASSALLQLINLPMLSGPYLSQFTNYANANGKWMRSFSQTFGMIGRTMGKVVASGVGKSTPLSDRRMLLDPYSPFVTARLKPDEIQVVQRAWEEGTLKPLLAIQQVGLTPGMHGQMPQSMRKVWHDTQSLMASAFGLMETSGRMTQFLAAYRLARDNPKVLPKAATVYANNPLFQSEMSRATTPQEQAYVFATFGIDEIMGQFDKTNRARYQRGIGALFTQFSNWVHQILELMARTFSSQGVAGKKAFAYMMIWLILAGGLQGLPGGENAKDLAELAWRSVTDKPIDLDLELRELVTNNLKNDYIDSRVLADYFARGPSRGLGLDISQRGALGRLPLSDLPTAIFGDSEFAANAGPFASVTIGNWRAYKDRVQAGEPKAQAAREFLPAAAQNAIDATLVWNTDGYRTRRGTVIVPPEDITGGMASWKLLGFTPTDIARAREEEWAKKRIAEAARKGPQQVYSNRLSRTLERISRAYWAKDDEGRKAAVAEWNKLMTEIREHNARQGDRNEHKILPNMKSIMQDALMNLKPELRQLRRAPVRARQAVREVDEFFPERSDD